MKISGIADQLPGLRIPKQFYLGTGWLNTSMRGWNDCISELPPEIEIDLSQVSRVTLYEWTTVVALIDRIAASQKASYEIKIDLIGQTGNQLLSRSDFLTYKKGEETRGLYDLLDVNLSERVYTVSGFLESLGTLGILNRPNRNGRVFYPGLSSESAGFRAF